MKKYLKKNMPATYKIIKAKRKFYKKGCSKRSVIEGAMDFYYRRLGMGNSYEVAAWAAWYGCALDKHGYKTVDDFIYWNLTKRA